MNIINYSIKIAAVHAKRLQYALDNLQQAFPLNATTLENLDMDQLLLIELLISRFSKLQDFMGNQLFNLLLSKAGESIDEMTFIDKINKLEKLRVIESADEWKEMRQLRNHLSHEYPDNPELTAKNLNQTYNLSHKLIKTLKETEDFLDKLK